MNKLMKKMLPLVFVLMLLVSSVTVLANSAETVKKYTDATYMGVVTAPSGLKVRSAAEFADNQIGGLALGSVVTVTGETTNFYEIKFNSGLAYVNKTYLKVTKKSDDTPSTTDAITTLNGYVGKINTKFANVHESYKFDSNSYDQGIKWTLDQGQEVNILGQNSKWYKIKYIHKKNTEIGYVYKSCVTLVKATNYIKLEYSKDPTSSPATITIKDTSPCGIQGLTATWSSTKKSVATVKKVKVTTAKVTPKKDGSAVIKCVVKAGKVSKTLKIKVKVSRNFNITYYK